jgi:hypothetical protein
MHDLIGICSFVLFLCSDNNVHKIASFALSRCRLGAKM